MIILFNPLSTSPGKQPLPLSLMSLAAVLGEEHPWTLVDGNLVADPASEILARFRTPSSSTTRLLAVTVMPGPQLTQAISVCRRVKAALPDVLVVWGGYFPTQHADTILASSFVDFVVRGQGEGPLLQLIAAIQTGGALARVTALSWKTGTSIIHNSTGALTPLDELPDLPYHRVDMTRYYHNNYLGRRTVDHNSSYGCPFACNFCAVVAMSNRRWVAQSPARMERVLTHLVKTYGIDAVQMHDMDFCVSEARTTEFADRIASLKIGWFALGRVDMLMQYSDATWRAMARSGLKMMFAGAESATDAKLAAMNKGGKASPSLTLELARRMREYGVIPEFSFVLGSPPDPRGDADATFAFIRRLKQINPATEIIFYAYTPVPMAGRLYDGAKQLGFAFPKTLEEWELPLWQKFSMRRGDGIPWMDSKVRQRVRNFERVLNAFYPTATDPRLTKFRRAVLKAVSGWRYGLQLYGGSYELRALHRLIRYQRPETTGF